MNFYLLIIAYIVCFNIVEELVLPSAKSDARFDHGRDYFDQTTIRDYLHPTEKYLVIRTILQYVFIPKYVPKGIQYNSKTATGMVGLENLGATCYLNALLQVPYFILCIYIFKIN